MQTTNSYNRIPYSGSPSGSVSSSTLSRASLGLRVCAGFTLLEIMLVIFVIGIAFGAVSMSMSSGGRDSEIKSAAKRLYGISTLALEEAIVTGTQLGLLFDIEGASLGVSGEPQYKYTWLEYDDEKDQWFEVDGHEMFNEFKLPPDIHLEVEIEGLNLIIGGKRERKSIFVDVENETEDFSWLEKDEKKKQIQPDIYFLSSGELIAFNIKISDMAPDSPVHRITGDMVGKISYINPADYDEDI